MRKCTHPANYMRIRESRATTAKKTVNGQNAGVFKKCLAKAENIYERLEEILSITTINTRNPTDEKSERK